MKARQPLLRLYLENRRYIPGLALILLISLLAGGLKLAASTLWGQAVDFGVAGRISPMLWAAGAMTLVILVDCARTAVHYHIIGRVTETMFRDVRMKLSASSPPATPPPWSGISARGTRPPA